MNKTLVSTVRSMDQMIAHMLSLDKAEPYGKRVVKMSPEGENEGPTAVQHAIQPDGALCHGACPEGQPPRQSLRERACRLIAAFYRPVFAGTAHLQHARAIHGAAKMIRWQVGL